MIPGSLSDPAECAIAVTPSDAVNLLVATRGIIVGVAGNVSLEMFGPNGTATKTCVIPVVAGIVYPFRCTRVNATSTTATSIVALW